jgi:hypothetical protein
MRASYTKSYVLKEIRLEDINLNTNLFEADRTNYEEFICSKCNNIIVNPINCQNCNKASCYHCVYKEHNEIANCPNCNKSVFSNICEDKLDRLNNMTLKCPSNKCTNKIEYKNLISHMSTTCKYAQRIAICLGCKLEIPTSNNEKEIKVHCITCKEIKSTCPYCSDSFNKQDYVAHMTACNDKSVKCKECDIAFSPKEFENHNWTACVSNLKQVYSNRKRSDGSFGERELSLQRRDSSSSQNYVEMSQLVKYYENKLREKDTQIETCNKRIKELSNIILENFNDSRTDIAVDNIVQMASDAGISKLNLSHREFNFKVFGELKLNTFIRDLNLEHSKIDGMTAVKIAKVLEKDNNLAILNLGNNYISNKGAEALAISLCQNNTLEEFYLSNNCFSNPGIIAFATTIKCNTKLEILFLDGNKENEFFNAYINDYNKQAVDSKRAFREAFKINKTLTILNVSGCDIVLMKYIEERLKGHQTIQLLMTEKRSTIGFKRKMTELHVSDSSKN